MASSMLGQRVSAMSRHMRFNPSLSRMNGSNSISGMNNIRSGSSNMMMNQMGKRQFGFYRYYRNYRNFGNYNWQELHRLRMARISGFVENYGKKINNKLGSVNKNAWLKFENGLQKVAPNTKRSSIILYTLLGLFICPDTNLYTTLLLWNNNKVNSMAHNLLSSNYFLMVAWMFIVILIIVNIMFYY